MHFYITEKFCVFFTWRPCKPWLTLLRTTFVLVCLTPHLLKTFQECQHYKDSNFSKMKYDLKCQRSSNQNYSSTFVYGPILMQFVWMLLSSRHNSKLLNDLKCYFMWLQPWLTFLLKTFLLCFKIIMPNSSKIQHFNTGLIFYTEVFDKVNKIKKWIKNPCN